MQFVKLNLYLQKHKTVKTGHFSSKVELLPDVIPNARKLSFKVSMTATESSLRGKGSGSSLHPNVSFQ